MSRTDKDMSYELRLEDELAPRASGRPKNNKSLYLGRAWIKSYEDIPKEAIVTYRFSDGRVMAFIYVIWMSEYKKTYGSKSIREAKKLARRNERRRNRHYYKQNYSSIDYDIDVETEFEVGTKARGLAMWWW